MMKEGLDLQLLLLLLREVLLVQRDLLVQTNSKAGNIFQSLTLIPFLHTPQSYSDLLKIVQGLGVSFFEFFQFLLCDILEGFDLSVQLCLKFLRERLLLQ
ncbi:hypothetical protein FGO68_gene1432 [Halteria grandinella]|uniref:Uncharacterized protein n=1 Tax=Halteria grandinella TaxID=5974 RepID=A0A8J8NX43_HALGN|nr:hypothetical protein FGO68_gene1432 [Halteria grandinella]